MKKQHLLLLSGVYSAISCTNNQHQDIKKPNIIFIMADDLGYADLGCYGQQIIKTPYIDSMAAGGIQYAQCYAGSSVCAPSRSVLMTGMHTGHTTVRGNFGKGGVRGLGGGDGRVPLSESDSTIAQVLKKAGYLTGMIGKWGLGEPHTTGEPYKKGFDYFFGFLNQRRAHTYYPEYIWRDTTKVYLQGNANGQKKEYTHDLFINDALDFIEKNKDTTFFLYIPLCIPHNDYEGPDNGVYENENWSETDKAYAAMVSRMDASVGKIINKLKALKMDENTIVFFTSDNGANGEAISPKIFDSGKPFKGSKRDPYEGGLRVPMIVYCPQTIQAGVKNNDLVWYFADVMPTLAALAGRSAPKQSDGINVLPSIVKNETIDIDRYLYWEFYERDGWRALRFGDWKAIEQQMYHEEHGEIELYNVTMDPGETNNVANDNPDIVKKAREMFEEAHQPSPHFSWKLKDKSKNTL